MQERLHCTRTWLIWRNGVKPTCPNAGSQMSYLVVQGKCQPLPYAVERCAHTRHCEDMSNHCTCTKIVMMESKALCFRRNLRPPCR